MMNPVEIAVRLYDIRDTVRRFCGDDYAARMREYGDALEAISERHDCSVLSAAIKVSEEHRDNGMLVLMVLSAALELIDPATEQTA